MKLKVISVTPEPNATTHRVVMQDEEGNLYTYPESTVTELTFEVSSGGGFRTILSASPIKEEKEPGSS